jgi:HSP20 family protein
MSQIAVEKPKTLNPRTSLGMNLFPDFFGPAFPFENMFSMNPFSLLKEFTNDRLFQGASPVKTWMPAVDIQRCDGNLVITAELPGLKKEEVKVEMVDNLLVIEGERKQEHKEDHEGFHRYERSYGTFYRAIALPEGVKMDEAKAELDNGLLKISVPAPEPKPNVRQVPVLEGSASQPPVA